jgi:hypothetical protein
MKKILFLFFINIIFCSCSLNSPKTGFEYRGTRYNLHSLNYVQDGSTYTYYLGRGYNGIAVIISPENGSNFSRFVLTINEPYEISIGSSGCRIKMPDGTEKLIDLTGDSNGGLEIDNLSRSFDTTALEILGTEVEQDEKSNYEDPYDIASIAAAFYNKKTYTYYSDENFHIRVIGFLIGIVIIGIGLWAVKFPGNAAEANNTSEGMIIFRGYFSIVLGAGIILFAVFVGF